MSPRDNKNLPISAQTQSQQVQQTSSSQAAAAAIASPTVSVTAVSSFATASNISGTDQVTIDTIADQFGGTTVTSASGATTNKNKEGAEDQMNETSLLENTTSAINNQQQFDKNTLFGFEMPFDVVSAGYAALVATGGIIGYLKAGSIPSLAAGLGFGTVLGIGAYMTSINPDNYYLTLGTATGLGGLMGYRFFNSHKFMPAGLIALLSVGIVTKIAVRALWPAQEATHVKE